MKNTVKQQLNERERAAGTNPDAAAWLIHRRKWKGKKSSRWTSIFLLLVAKEFSFSLNSWEKSYSLNQWEKVNRSVRIESSAIVVLFSFILKGENKIYLLTNKTVWSVIWCLLKIFPYFFGFIAQITIFFFFFTWGAQTFDPRCSWVWDA